MAKEEGVVSGHLTPANALRPDLYTPTLQPGRVVGAAAAADDLTKVEFGVRRGNTG